MSRVACEHCGKVIPAARMVLLGYVPHGPKAEQHPGCVTCEPCANAWERGEWSLPVAPWCSQGVLELAE